MHIEACIAKEATAMHSISEGEIEISLEEKREEIPTSAPSHVPSMPSFGRGIARQSSFAPARLTESEVAAQHDMLSLCAAGLDRLARRSRRQAMRGQM